MVITDVNQVVYQGDGATTAFPFTFRIIDATDIKLLLIDADGTETDITSDYFVDTNTNTVYYPGYAPGAEPGLADQPAPVQEGQRLVVYRELPVTQEKDLGEKWPFFVIELALDKLTMLIQGISGIWNRCLRVTVGQSATHPDFDYNIPIEAGKTFRVKDDGTGFELTEDPAVAHAAAVAAQEAAERAQGIAEEARDDAEAAADNAEDALDLIKEKATWFDNVVAMKAAAGLQVGMLAGTKGYYSINDGGSAIYNIRAKTQSDVDDEGSIIFLDNGNVAELITDGTVNVKQFGAVGDGVTDDTIAIRNAIKMQGGIRFNTNETYAISDVIRLKKNTVIDFCNCYIKFTGASNRHLFFNFETTDEFTEYNGNGNLTIKNGFLEGAAFSFIHGENILVENCHFSNCENDHYFEICACKNYVISNCSFKGMHEFSRTENEYVQIDCCDSVSFPWFSSDNPTYDGTPNSDITIRNCIFQKGSKTGYTQLNACIGSHMHIIDNKMHKNINIKNCGFYGYSYRALALWEIDGGSVTDCKFDSTGGDGTPIDLYCLSCQSMLIQSNDFGYSKNTSVFVSRGEAVSVVNNRQHDTTQKFCALYLGTQHNVIGNIVEDTRYGVSLDAATNITCVKNYSKRLLNEDARFISEFKNNSSFLRNDNFIIIDGTEHAVSNNKIVLSDLNTDFTKVSQIQLKFGAMYNATWDVVTIPAYIDRCFLVNETFSFTLHNGNYCTLKIVSATDIEITLTTPVNLRRISVLYNTP